MSMLEATLIRCAFDVEHDPTFLRITVAGAVALNGGGIGNKGRLGGSRQRVGWRQRRGGCQTGACGESYNEKGREAQCFHNSFRGEISIHGRSSGLGAR